MGIHDSDDMADADAWTLLGPDGIHRHRHDGRVVIHGHGDVDGYHRYHERPGDNVMVEGVPRHTADTRTRVLRPGSKVGRTLYDAETGELVGMVDTPELAEWLCEVVWRDARTRALLVDEDPIDRGLVEHLDARYGLDEGPRGEYPEPDDQRPEVVEVNTQAMAPREPTIDELAQELVWQTRRMLDTQWDVAQTLGRVQAAAARAEQ